MLLYVSLLNACSILGHSGKTNDVQQNEIGFFRHLPPTCLWQKLVRKGKASPAFAAGEVKPLELNDMIGHKWDPGQGLCSVVSLCVHFRTSTLWAVLNSCSFAPKRSDTSPVSSGSCRVLYFLGAGFPCCLHCHFHENQFSPENFYSDTSATGPAHRSAVLSSPRPSGGIRLESI